MAKAKVKSREIVKRKIKLTLTPDEAGTLLDLLGRTAGFDAETGHRVRINAIYDALKESGVSVPDVRIPLRSLPYIQEPN